LIEEKKKENKLLEEDFIRKIFT